MATSRARSGWRSLEALMDAGALGGLTDGELLEYFQTRRDALGHEAFRILVERHGPMVLGLCRSVVRDPHEADDAFQATFLVLVRKAGSIKRRDTIGPWLHGVAGRVARRARERAIRRRRREVEVNHEIPCPGRPVAESPSLEEIIQAEISRLPEALRAPIVLCCLEGLSYDLAARRLGVTEPTLRGRLHRARKRLASRLRGRGITAGTFASAIGPVRLALPPLSPSLVESTVQFSVRWSSVIGLLSGAAVIPDSITGLAQGVIKIMLLKSMKLSGIVVLFAAGALGAVVVAQQAKSGGSQSATPTVTNPTAQAEEKADPRAGREQAKGEKAARKSVELAPQEKTKQIEQQLDLLVDAKFPEGIRFDRFLKYTKLQTTKLQPPGIPIYVNRVGLQEAQKDMTFMVRVNLKQTPVRVILDKALWGTGLSFAVRDGFLMIDSRTGILESRVKEIDRKLDRVLNALDRLEKTAK